MSKTTLSKAYDASEVEPRWLRFWLTQDYFHADETAPKAPYSIILPPPNVTGSLHMGHALGFTLQDVLVRWRRMQAFNALWLPGTDHASIATEMLVERHIKRTEGKTKLDVGREGFLERAWAWKERFGNRIVEQMKVFGYSLDWERFAFTMDDERSVGVRECFVRLYEEKLIFRAKRLINWCTDCKTAVSDLEVENAEEAGQLWHIHYPVVDSDERLTVATTRPETMLGDTGVAVHPEDERYRHLVGRKVALPLTGREIPVVADDFVDREFGTGVVKVTPGHDFTDFECGLRNGLEQLSVIDLGGKIIAPAPAKYVGMTVAEARAAVVADLEAAGLLAKVEDHTLARGRCQRSNTVIEPLLSMQWFVKASVLAEPAIAAVESGKTRLVPELWTKTYMHWMTRIKDWCISRQLWWGHRIPAWYCANGHTMVERRVPERCPECGDGALRQDDDVLDTWFSSALWPMSTLGWPEQTRDLRAFYPTSVLVTGPDIIFFWVARMMMMGLHFLKKVPFKVVYLTPIVTDGEGEKMSKVKGNVIDPLDVIHGSTLQALVEKAESEGAPEHAVKEIKRNFPDGIPAAGADALRFALAAMATPGRNMRLSLERIEGYRNFVNKLWNASRFALMNLDDFNAERFVDLLAHAPDPDDIAAPSLADRWILSRLHRTAQVVDEALEAFRFSDAASALYQFVWGELCDWYIELAKPVLYDSGMEPGGGTAERRFRAQGTLATALETTLRLLHPFMPFVTEEIWQKLPRPAGLPASLMITIYPESDARFLDEEAERIMDLLQSVAVAVRTLRSTYNVPPSWSVPVEVRVADDDKRNLLERHRSVVENAAKITMTLVAGGDHVPMSAKQVVGADVEVVVPLAGLVDVDAEKARIGKELAKADKEIAQVRRKLDNESFVARAPASVVEKDRARLVEEEERRGRLLSALEALG